MPVGDIFSVDVASRYQNNDNVMCFLLRLAIQADQSAVLDDIALWIAATLVPGLQPLHGSDVAFPCVITRQVYPTNSLPDVTELIAIQGTRSGVGANPGQLSLVTTLFGNILDPTGRNRGRDFWYGAKPADITVTGDKFEVTFAQEVLDFYQALGNTIQAATGNDFEIGIFSRTQALENDNPDFVGEDGIKNSDRPTFGDPVFNQLIFVRTSRLIRTQRRRQPEDICIAYLSETISASP